jgi:hypothetical protein
MNPQTKTNALLALALMLAIALACNRLGDDTNKANGLVGEGNKAIAEANKASVDALSKNTQLFTGIKSFPGDREKVKGAAQEEMDLIDKSSASFREASKKFEEASKLKLEEKFKEYLSLKSQEFSKHAEQVDVAKELPQAVLDPAVKDAATLRNKITGINDRVQKLETEWRDLETKADKIREDNKDKFKS